MGNRKFDTKVQHLKYKVLREVARLAWDDQLMEKVMDVPKMLVPGNQPTMRCCVYKERAILGERVKLAMGGDSENPNVIEVIEIACDECPVGGYEVTNACRGCLAHRCEDVCKRGAITFDANHVAHIDKTKCIECGACAKVCPYTAIVSRKRPCQNACKVKAISMNEQKAAKIDNSKCIQCGACVYQCPFGALMDKSYILDAVNLIKESNQNKSYKVYAIVAPSISSQFRYAKFGQVITGLKATVFIAEKPDGEVIYTVSSKKLTVDYDYFEDDNVVIKTGLMFYFGGDEIFVGTTYNITLTDAKEPAAITSQPKNITFTPGQRAYVFVTADHATAYEWHVVYGETDYLAAANPIDGVNFRNCDTDKMNIAASRCTKFEVYCIVTGTDGSNTTSEKAGVTVGTAPVVVSFTGGSIDSEGSTIFRIGGKNIESVEWIISNPVPSSRPGELGYDVSTLDEFISANRGVRALKDVRVTDTGVVATLVLIGLPANADRYYVNAVVSNEIGKTLSGDDAGIKMKFAVDAPVIISHPTDSSCGVGGTLSYAMTAEGMTSSKWVFEYVVGKENATFTLDQMKEKFPKVTFTATHAGNTTTLTISGADDELNGYAVYAVAVGESTNTSSYTARMTVVESDSTPGDVNRDTKINLGDVSLMLKYIAKWDVELDLQAADVTDDGKVNLGDVSLMLKYIAKWDVVLK